MKLFFELIRVALGTQESLTCVPTADDWKLMLNMAKKQALVGICFYGLNRVYESEPQTAKNLPLKVKMNWLAMASYIEKRNLMMNEYTRQALDIFRNEGFACQVLKGQGIAKLYVGGRICETSKGKGGMPINQKENVIGKLEKTEMQSHTDLHAPLDYDMRLLRQSGDIDVWVATGRETLCKLAKEKFGKIEGLNYHHIAYPVIDGVDIEAHFRPAVLSSPRRFARLERFCKKYKPENGGGDTPSLEFNRMFIMLHAFSHFMTHGVGMRQIMDYYFVLKASYETETNERWKAETMKILSDLGMRRFAEGMMWMMKTVMGMDDDCLLCEPNRAYGQFILNEVMLTGNMGHGDERVNRKWLKTAAGRYALNLKRAWDVMTVCPHESLWYPAWNVYRYVWCWWKSL